MRVKKSKIYNNDWPIVAICYDFDKTLSPQDMQNFSLIPKLNCDVDSFWKESNKYAREQGMDKILAYMKTILDKAGSNIRITDRDFKALGKSIELFPGVDSWFDRINAMAERIGVNVEHYIISAGLREIIQGTSIANYFTEIYASSFAYDPYHRPVWPKQVVNYTSKTQYLFRISKDCLDLCDEDSVNEYQDDDERRISFRNFIYIGDSETDIPAMKIIKKGGGVSIGVYNPQTGNLERVKKLLQQERIDYLMPADYSQNQRLELLVSDILKKVKASDTLWYLNRRQNHYMQRLDDVDRFVTYTADFLDSNDLDEGSFNEVKKKSKQILKRMHKDLVDMFGEISSEDEIARFMEDKEKAIQALMQQKRKQIKEESRSNKRQKMIETGESSN